MKRILFAMMVLTSCFSANAVIKFAEITTGGNPSCGDPYTGTTFTDITYACSYTIVTKPGEWGQHAACHNWGTGGLGGYSAFSDGTGGVIVGVQAWCNSITLNKGTTASQVVAPYALTTWEDTSVTQTQPVQTYMAGATIADAVTFAAPSTTNTVEVDGSAATAISGITVLDSLGHSMGTAVHATNGKDWLLQSSSFVVGQPYTINVTGAVSPIGIAQNSQYSVNIPGIPVAIPQGMTWTPILLFGGGSTGLTYVATGHYAVTNGYVEGDYEASISAKGSSNGTITLGNLPVPADNTNAANSGGGPVNSYSGFTALPGVPWMYVDTSNVLHMVYGNTTGFVSLSSSVLTNTSAFRGTFKYKIAQ